MAKKQISALLWRRANKATIDSLTGVSQGQYDIRLTRKPGIPEFFDGLTKGDVTDLGGFTLEVSIEPCDCDQPINTEVIRVRYMGDSSQRKDWYIRAQRPDSAYPLWRPGRGIPIDFKFPPDGTTQFLVLAKDVDKKIHARWINEDDFSQLPTPLQQILQSDDVGVYDTGATKKSNKAHEINESLRQHTNVLIYGPPGTGKSYIMRQVEELFCNPAYFIDTAKERKAIAGGGPVGQTKTGWVTFHQSYSYEDFIIGLRPNPSSTALLSLEPVPGLLLQLAEFARRQSNSSLLLIDEINRGNVSRIFGEFITLLEPDKRLGMSGQMTRSTVAVQLPYIRPTMEVRVPIGTDFVPVPNPFTMPRPVYTLASMNSVDKSIAPLDAALRRRFHVYNLEPDLNEISQFTGVELPSEANALTVKYPLTGQNSLIQIALALLQFLNRGIGYYLGPEYQLGQWYLDGLCREFDTVDEAIAALLMIWKSKLLPQLEELFNGRVEQLATILKLDSTVNQEEFPVFLEQPREYVVELGGLPYLRHRAVAADKELDFLMRVAGVQVQR